MASRNYLSPTRSYGAVAIAAGRFVPGASTAAIVTNESWGVNSIVRDGTGLYTVSLKGKPRGFVVLVSETENDTTTYHFVRVESQSDSAATFQISHKSVAFASVATGPAASDTVDGINFVVFERTE
jgi:hypothetical protein